MALRSTTSQRGIIREEPAATHFHKFVLDVDASGTRIFTAGHNKLMLWEAAA